MKIKKLLEKVMPIIDRADLYDENGKHIVNANQAKLIQDYGSLKVKRISINKLGIPLGKLIFGIVVKR